MHAPASSLNPNAPADDIVMTAIDWMVKLQSGVATEAEREACRRWRAQSEQHELAWSRLQNLSERVGALPPELAHGVIGAGPARGRHNRRFAVKTLGLALGIGLLVLAGGKTLPWQPLLAQYSTRAGERRRVVLADGSVVDLNTATAIDTRYDDSVRLVQLHRGELLIATARDLAASYRPFLVQTRLGQARALGTRFQVHDSAAGMLVAVYEGAVEFAPADNSAPIRIDAGHAGLFDRHGLAAPLAAANEEAAAWTDGFIVADRMRLGQLVAELDRYMPGKLRCDEAIAALPISGVFPIDQPARILAALARTLPVRIDALTSYWITVRPKPST
ncbi:FecR domain-containing protein [Herbaspirillum sp. WKF16]|jgi:transmembrane sensor|uniref:FecR domain-containing protein n=1 Tax=Herbaspirillum sp. WKF16 TaxID=3028312 RepID=UPI0023A94638|nr:FecR domain-containing protein [Herbaspirillum sp. WKF16]WDZ95666.1 FecR domain-containing protein [Herbaspirillum sp. WKF16]